MRRTMVMIGHAEHKYTHLEFARPIRLAQLEWLLEELTTAPDSNARKELQVAVESDGGWTRPIYFGDPEAAEAFAWKCKSQGITARLAKL